MKVLIQRVKKSSVTIEGKLYSSIGSGILALVGIEKGDTLEKVQKAAKKISNLRIFPDENNKMNLSIIDVKGEMLIVSQFTLAGDTSRGNRPGFDNAAKPETALQLYNYFSKQITSYGISVKNGIFQADMEVELINDGPVTFMLEK